MNHFESIESIGLRLWDLASDYGTQQPLTEEAVAECEAHLGISLPADLIALLRQRNGGCVTEACSAFMTNEPTSWETDHVPFELMMGISSDRDDVMSIDGSPYLNREWGQPEQLVLLTGEGHWWIALNYRDPNVAEPSVVWFDNEVGEDIRLAETFGDFVRGLTTPPPIED